MNVNTTLLMPLMLLLLNFAVSGSQGSNATAHREQNGQLKNTRRLSSEQDSILGTDSQMFDYALDESSTTESARGNSTSKMKGGKTLEQVVFQLLKEGNKTEVQASLEDSDLNGNINQFTDEIKQVLANKGNFTNSSQIMTHSDGVEGGGEASTAMDQDGYSSQSRDIESRRCSKLVSVEVNSGRLLANGSLLSLDDNMVYPPEYFWRSSNNSYRGCYCLLRPCLRKCCPEGRVLTQDLMHCEESDSQLLYPFSPNYTDEAKHAPRLLYGMPCRESIYMLEPEDDPQDEYFLYSNGSLYEPFEMKSLNSTEFCLEVSEELGGIFPFTCIANDGVIGQPERGIHYAIGMIICIPFLAATFVAYAFLPELRTLHGKCFMCHIGCNLVGYISLVVIQIWQNDFTDTTCTIFAMVAFFVNLTSFTWLSAMCFDIWWTFSNFLPSRDGMKQEIKKFMFYSAYSWGIPLLILIICIIMDFTPGIPEYHIKPEFGKQKCWLSTPEAWMAYYFGPVTILMFCNFMLFVVTAVKIQRIKKETAVLKNKESRRHREDNKQQSKLYFNLFIVMGISRMAVMIAWAILITMKLNGVVYMWIIIHLLEVGMCIVFIGKRQLWTRLLQATTCCKYFIKVKEPSRQESASSNSTTVTVESNEGAIEMRKVSLNSVKPG